MEAPERSVNERFKNSKEIIDFAVMCKQKEIQVEFQVEVVNPPQPDRYRSDTFKHSQSNELINHYQNYQNLQPKKKFYHVPQPNRTKLDTQKKNYEQSKQEMLDNLARLNEIESNGEVHVALEAIVNFQKNLCEGFKNLLKNVEDSKEKLEKEYQDKVNMFESRDNQPITYTLNNVQYKEAQKIEQENIVKLNSCQSPYETSLQQLRPQYIRFLELMHAHVFYKRPGHLAVKKRILSITQNNLKLFYHDNFTTQSPNPDINRYGQQVLSTNLAELNHGQWLSNITIDFYCEYLNEMHALKYKFGSQPNLIMPTRLFPEHFKVKGKDFSAMEYFVQFKRSFGLPAGQSLLSAFRFVGFPFNLSEQHWIAVAIDTKPWGPKQRKRVHYLKKNQIILFDSYRSSQFESQKQHLIQTVHTFINYDDPDGYSAYDTVTTYNAWQENGSDCGVFVLKFLQVTMNGSLEEAKLNFTQKDCTEFRKQLLYLLLMIGNENKEQYKYLDMKLLSDIESGNLEFPKQTSLLKENIEKDIIRGKGY